MAARAAVVLAMLLLAGCVQAIDEEPPEPPVFDDCCEGPVQRCTDCGGFGVCSDCFDVNASRPTRPLLALFDARPLHACEGCLSASIAARGDEVLVATERSLAILLANGEVTILPAPTSALAPAALPWELSAPHLHVDADGRAWYVALAAAGAARSVLLAVWDEGAEWTRAEAIVPMAAPALPSAERVWAQKAGGTLVLVVAGAEGAWALRSLDEGASFDVAESLTPPGGSARFGAPSLDARGRVVAPFAFFPTQPSSLVPVVAGVQAPLLYYAALGDGASSWTFHGGASIPSSIAEGARPAFASAPAGASFLWVDAAGGLSTLGMADESWGQAILVSARERRAVGTPAILRDTPVPRCDDTTHCAPAPDGARVSYAWWEEGALVAGRAHEDATPARTDVAAASSGPRSVAALTLAGDGRAVVGWVEGEEVWIAVERPG